jgi:hypothetical protein
MTSKIFTLILPLAIALAWAIKPEVGPLFFKQLEDKPCEQWIYRIVPTSKDSFLLLHQKFDQNGLLIHESGKLDHEGETNPSGSMSTFFADRDSSGQTLRTTTVHYQGNDTTVYKFYRYGDTTVWKQRYPDRPERLAGGEVRNKPLGGRTSLFYSENRLSTISVQHQAQGAQYTIRVRQAPTGALVLDTTQAIFPSDTVQLDVNLYKVTQNQVEDGKLKYRGEDFYASGGLVKTITKIYEPPFPPAMTGKYGVLWIAPSDSITYLYDAQDSLVQVTQFFDAGKGQHITRFEYRDGKLSAHYEINCDLYQYNWSEHCYRKTEYIYEKGRLARKNYSFNEKLEHYDRFYYKFCN